MITRLLNNVRRLCFDRFFHIPRGGRVQLRHTVVSKDAKEVKELQDALGATLRIELHFSPEGAFVPFEWSTGVDERAVFKDAAEKEVVIQDDLHPEKTLIFDYRHIRYLPVGVNWPAILPETKAREFNKDRTGETEQ